ncbi:hypothetical protein D3C86_2017900 [compost metagenome]
MAEHALLDHFPELFVTCPGGVAPVVPGAGTQGELYDFVAEILGVCNPCGLFDLRQLAIENVAI